MQLRKAGTRLAIFAALVAALMALSATVALAGPADPTLNVTQLQAAIDANGGSLDGYLKTVMKGKDIVELDVTVLAVTTGYGSGPADMSSFILFESNDPAIDAIGGIAAGMSGSPIYVDDGTGTDKLVGALSYGDMFTTRGTGLATPIEAMANVQANYSLASVLPRMLMSPVIVEGQIKDRIIVPSDPTAVAAEPANTIVARPLASVYLAGVSPQSKLYKTYAKALASRGIELFTPRAGGLSAMTSTYSAEFEGGSAIAVLSARGDLWSGGIGTVTYVDTPTVVAFGHPMYYEGDTSQYMCNAWIDGVWPSTYMAYKLGRPAAVRGTLKQDRLAGIVGVDGPKPVDIPITAKATRGSKVATSAVQIPPFVADSSSGNYFGLPTFGAYIAGSRLFDANSNKGSALTTTTVVVQDGSGPIYTVVRRNVYSDGWDIPSAVVADVDDMVTSLQSANGNGIANGHILSVNLESEFSATRNEAEIVDLKVPGGLKTGDNTVTVSFLQYGKADTQTVDVALSIPADVPVTGELTASSVNFGGDGGDFTEADFLQQFFGMDMGSSTTDRRTVKDVVDELNKAVDNTVMSVSFKPELISDSPSLRGEGDGTPTEELDAIETTVATDWVVSGSLTKAATQFVIYDYSGPRASYGQPAYISGSLTGLEGKSEFTVSGTGVPTETIVATDGSFRYVSPPLYRRTTLTFTFAGDDSALPTQDVVVVTVYAKVSIHASKKTLARGSALTLSATVRPKNAGGSVTFQRMNGRTWKNLKTVRLSSSGTARYKYRPGKAGTLRVRARFNGSVSNRKNYSRYEVIKVK
jgi:hypothetical protein